MLKNKDNFFETNIIIPNINKKRNSKFLKRHEIVHLIVDISLLVVKCAFRIRFNVILKKCYKNKKWLKKTSEYYKIKTKK